MVLEHLSTSNFHGWRKFTPLNSKFAIENPEAADPLEIGELLIDSRHHILSGLFPFGAVIVERQDGCHVRAFVADQHNLAHDWFQFEETLDPRRIDFLATRRDDQFLFATGDKPITPWNCKYQNERLTPAIILKLAKEFLLSTGT